MNIQETSYREILDNLDEGVYLVDRQRRITYWSRAAERITGFKRSEVTGLHCMDNILNHVDEEGRPLCANGCPFKKTFSSGKPHSEKLYFHHSAGHLVPVTVSIVPVKNSNGNIIGASHIFVDNTAQDAARERFIHLSEMALIDPLTRVGNRRFTEMVLKERLEEMKRYGRGFGVLFIDMDSFKLINDSFGHDTGDRVLQMASATIQNSLRPFDFIGRWGGDEFVSLVVNIGEKELHRIAERTRSLVVNASLSRVSEISRVTVSIGATLARHGDTVASLLKRADMLMYRSKRAGQNRVTWDGSLSAVCEKQAEI